MQPIATTYTPKSRSAPGLPKQVLIYSLVGIGYQAIVITVVFLVTRNAFPWGYSFSVLYPVFTIVFLLLGFLHAWLERNYLPELVRAGFGGRILLVIGFVITGLGLLLVETHFLFRVTRHIALFSGTSVLFPVPLLWTEAYERWLNIPPPQHKPWPLPEHPAPEIDMLDLSVIQVVKFEFLREPDDPYRADSRVKAPVYLAVGELFHVFLKDYNSRFTGTPIVLQDDQQRPFDWVFYVWPRSWWQSRRYIDPFQNFAENRLKDGDRLVAERV